MQFLIDQKSAILGALLILSYIVTLLNLARTLPAQNVFAVGIVIGLTAEVIEAIGAKFGIPFGLYFFTDAAGPSVFGFPPWPIPLLWTVIMLNSRGVARLCLRPWRKISNYGHRVIGLTCFLVVCFDALLEPFASRVSHYWIWLTPRRVPAWYGAPWVDFPARAVVALLVLAFVTPWLIQKKDGVKNPPDYVPLMIWVALTLLLAMLDAVHGLWSAAAVGIVTVLIIPNYAWRNSRW